MNEIILPRRRVLMAAAAALAAPALLLPGAAEAVQPRLNIPVFTRPTSIVISPQSPESIGGMGCKNVLSTAASSGLWPTANLAIAVPFRLRKTTAFACLFVVNGAVVNGNFDLGIYDDGGGTSTVNRIVSTGSTAQAGTNVPQSVATAFILGPGNYYMVSCFDGVVATVFSKVPAAAAVPGVWGMAQVANGSVTLGSTLTFALNNTAFLPLFGLSQKAAV